MSSVSIEYLALCLLPNIGGKTLRNLLAHFGTASHILKAPPEDLIAVPGVGPKIAQSIHTIDLTQVESDLQRWQAAGIHLITIDNPAYPAALKPLDDAPPLLFVRGQIEILQSTKMAAIVGTRKPSEDARQIAFALADQLAQGGWIIVSGLALGIDAAAHRGSIQADSGRTVAVLGGGVLNIYPPEHQQLSQQILDYGAILSENPPMATSKSARLVARNRIISGLCQHVIVVETEINGGAMYAAKSAVAQGRRLHVVGLPVSGNLELLKNKASYIAPDLGNLTVDFAD